MHGNVFFSSGFVSNRDLSRELYKTLSQHTPTTPSPKRMSSTSFLQISQTMAMTRSSPSLLQIRAHSLQRIVSNTPTIKQGQNRAIHILFSFLAHSLLFVASNSRMVYLADKSHCTLWTIYQVSDAFLLVSCRPSSAYTKFHPCLPFSHFVPLPLRPCSR